MLFTEIEGRTRPAMCAACVAAAKLAATRGHSKRRESVVNLTSVVLSIMKYSLSGVKITKLVSSLSSSIPNLGSDDVKRVIGIVRCLRLRSASMSTDRGVAKSQPTGW